MVQSNMTLYLFSIQGGDDEYSLLVNLKRLYEIQLQKSVPMDSFYDDFVKILTGNRNMDSEVRTRALQVAYHFSPKTLLTFL